VDNFTGGTTSWLLCDDRSRYLDDLWLTVIHSSERYSGCLQADSAQQIEGMQQPASEALPLTTNDNDDHVTSESLALPPGDVTAEDPDVITTDSLTLPRIEHVLRSEGVRSLSISQQIDSLRKKVDRCINILRIHSALSR